MSRGERLKGSCTLFKSPLILMVTDSPWGVWLPFFASVGSREHSSSENRCLEPKVTGVCTRIIQHAFLQPLGEARALGTQGGIGSPSVQDSLSLTDKDVVA